ncbi:PGF-CTERM sorting domain-containing protein [Halorussus halophilus]|uniref:PGF-CTERM sorting domain-containing protein n=1 Tax=Halorussus halophilus TaxID=2650975 RepID=UPI00130168ED|nr:PGF-CTERM sorting domain-containing protein [Halorussus halophilus]
MKRTVLRVQVLLLVAALVVSVAAPTAIGATSNETATTGAMQGEVSSAHMNASPSSPNATSTHEVGIPITSDATFTSVKLTYEGDANVSAVDAGNVVRLGVDRGNNGGGYGVDVDATDTVTNVSAKGQTLVINTTGDLNLSDGDELIVAYEDVKNPSKEKDYALDVDVNPDQSGGTGTATLTLRDHVPAISMILTGNKPKQLTVEHLLPADESGFLVVTNESGAVIGTSSQLNGSTPYESEYQTVELSRSKAAQNATVTYYDDSNGNDEFDASEDEPFTVNGKNITKSVQLAKMQATTQQTTTSESNATTTGVTDTTTDVGETTTAASTTEDSGSSGTVPGFGPLAALVALVGAALLATRR